MTWTTIKSVYLKITLSRFSIAFFLFVFIHCFAEGFIQAFIFSQDSTASNVVTSILRQTNVPRNNFGVLNSPYGNTSLDVCNMLRPDLKEQPCAPVFQKGTPNLPLPTEFNLTSHIFQQGLQVTSTVGGGVKVVLNDKPIQLNQMCTLVLTYPHQMLMNAQREDVVLVLSQFWIFALSFFGIVYDSIPHLVAAICCRTLATAWSMYIVWRNGDNQYRFAMLLSSEDSPCKPLQLDDLFPGYFASRQALQIPDVTLNIIAFILSIYLSSKLIKVYSANTFNRVGAPPAIIRIYNYFLAVFVSFQVSALLLVSVICLWLDQLVNRDNAMSGFTFHRTLYLALSIFTLVFLIPWITIGWYAVRRERKRLMVVFLTLGTIVFASWVLMLKSWSFAWTFMNWPFFSVQFTAASVSLLSTIIFGVISYLHFDKGLAHYLYVDDQLAKAGFEPELFEKDLEKGGAEDWREIGLDDIPTYTLQFSTSSDRIGHDHDSK
ncbi:hypothetical protein MIND_00251000 [Mycena indigotica]|uniref:Uncharacterized protein n=1 Tax=Mycena indigotica TaxID=2126181 RepID=A0A8H6WC17_9AGAR|nr:uncharacterized protein MIND_00251000 [Mycena indigotica]KAF7312377.1 hypothetical protein MIND_00251000 [Mycena indigotica]